MDLLLTSGGVSNPSIRTALEEMLGKPVEECTALAVPTAEYGHPACTPFSALALRRRAAAQGPMTGLGWGAVGLLELTALESVGEQRWVPWVEQADVLLVDGGDAAVPGPLAAALGPGAAAAVAVRGLGRDERREHGHDAAGRAGLRRLGAAGGRRRDPRRRRLLAVPAPGPPGHARRTRSSGPSAGPRASAGPPTPWTTRARSGCAAARSTSSPRAPGTPSADDPARTARPGRPAPPRLSRRSAPPRAACWSRRARRPCTPRTASGS